MSALRRSWILALLVLMALVGRAPAEPSPEAVEWLTKMFDRARNGAYSTRFQMDVNATAFAGQPGRVEASGTVLSAGDLRQRSEWHVVLSGMDGAEAPMTMDLLQVVDGNHMWTQTKMPQMGMTQVMRVSVAALDEMIARATGSAVPIVSQSPIAMIETLVQRFDVEVLESNGEVVVLGAVMTEEFLREMGEVAALDAGDPPRFRIALDPDSALPRSVSMDGDPPMLRIDFFDTRTLTEDEIPEGSFDYAPPEGAPVIDLDEMMEQPGDDGSR